MIFKSQQKNIRYIDNGILIYHLNIEPILKSITFFLIYLF
jgi:hypothetical protein